jgi:flagellum-specific ATP synthase
MTPTVRELSGKWSAHLARNLRDVQGLPPPPVEGRLTRMVGLTLEAQGCQAAIGDRCDVTAGDGTLVEAEVVGFAADRLYLMPTGDIHGLRPSARVIPRTGAGLVKVGPEMLGRVIDGAGHPLDGKGPLHCEGQTRLTGNAINPLQRAPITQTLDVGVRAINALLTVGRGQRIGLFAGSGVGKSVLLGMMARYTEADIIVVGLVGERGREVKEFIEDILGAEGLARSVVVAAPADSPPLLRMQGANYATAIAEHFRDQGRHVLLLMDSLTRFAMAQREIALAIGEPPATKGYPPSCFAKLPQLVERSGNGLNGVGSITAFYTVLSEGDDPQDPIADAARGILDGHIVLSRELAEAGHYPAIDVERSISRVMNAVSSREQVEAARRARAMLARVNKARDLIQLGAYQSGHDADLDQAIALHPQLIALLQQDMQERAPLAQSRTQLCRMLNHSFFPSKSPSQ